MTMVGMSSRLVVACAAVLFLFHVASADNVADVNEASAIRDIINAVGGAATSSTASNMCNNHNVGVNVSCTADGYVNHIEWYQTHGSIPQSVSLLAKLTSLWIKSSTITVPLPAGLNALSANLVDLAIHHSEGLAGTVLPINSLVHLTYLRLDHNFLAGTVPSVFKPLVDLHVLRLDYNSLSGTFPYDYFSAMQSLQYLAISDNLFTGTLPQFSYPNLWLLDVKNCFWTGSIPASLATNNPKLQHLSVGHNPFLGGSIPNSFSKLTDLEYLYMGNSSFNGTLPAGLGSMTSLQSLWLDHNFFYGTLPNTISKLGNLVVLDLSYNALTGPLPKTLFPGFPGVPYSANLRFNYFTGSADITSPPNIQAANVSNNCLLKRSPLLRGLNNQRTPDGCKAYCLTGVWDNYAVPCVGHGLCIPTLLNNDYTGSHFRCSNCQPFPYTSYYYYATCAKYTACTTLASSTGGCTCPPGSALTTPTCNPKAYRCCCPPSAPFGVQTKDSFGRLVMSSCTNKDPGA